MYCMTPAAAPRLTRRTGKQAAGRGGQAPDGASRLWEASKSCGYGILNYEYCLSGTYKTLGGERVKKTAAKGHTRKHAKATRKHATTAKHHPVHHVKAASAHGHSVHTKAKHPAHAKAKGLALDGVACCVAEALASSLRRQGLSVAGSDVLALHRLASADDDRGAPVLVMLEAASAFGLAGFRPRITQGGEPDFAALLAPAPGRADGRQLNATSLILSLDQPSHAVLATPEGWWSWGELWCPCEFPDAVIDGAWLVSWAYEESALGPRVPSAIRQGRRGRPAASISGRWVA